MSIFQSLKQDAVDFLEPYKTKEPATYAAAEQAIGAILITDGLVGLGNPFGAKKRPGIFGTIGGMIVGIIFMLIPTIFGNLSGISKMTAVTTATVDTVGTPVYTTSTDPNTHTTTNNGPTCSLAAHYTVNGQVYTNQSSMSSGDNCALTTGQAITVNYDPANPSAWAYGAKRFTEFLQIFFWAGVLALLSSIVTFFIRLFSIIFGWKLVKDGRKNAAGLPQGTNLSTMIAEIKHNFTAQIFGFPTQSAQPAVQEVPTNLQNPQNPVV